MMDEGKGTNLRELTSDHMQDKTETQIPRDQE